VILVEFTTVTATPIKNSWLFGPCCRADLTVAALCLGCQLRAPAPTECPGPTSAPDPSASISFVQGGGELLQWDFLVRGLPAVEYGSGLVVVADRSRGEAAASLGLSVLRLGQGEARPRSVRVLLDEDVASRLLYEGETAGAEPLSLSEEVRGRVDQANLWLGSLRLRPMLPCAVQQMRTWCKHPQRIECPQLAAELVENTLRPFGDASFHEVVPGWGMAPMALDGRPPEEMVPCVEAAYWDPPSRLLVAEVTAYCRHPGGDACVVGLGWRVVALR